MKTIKMTEEEKVYDELRQAYGVQRSPAMMKLLEFLFPTMEEVEIGKHLENLYSGGTPKTIEEVAKESGKDVEKVKEVIEKLGRRIIIKWREREGEPGITEYYNTGGLGLKNAWGHVGKEDEEGLVFRGLINKVLDEQRGRTAKFKPKTLQIDETIHADVNILPYEMASDVIKAVAKAGKPIVAMYCNCREYRRNCNRRHDNCLAFGALAEYYVMASKHIPGGRPLSFISGEEALKVLDEAFKEGLVANLIAPAARAQGKEEIEFDDIFSICLCCSCCCEGLSRYVEYGDTGTLPEFVPECNEDKCVLCDACVKICPVNARWHNWPVKADLSDEFIHLDPKKCIGCGLCAFHCSHQALRMVRSRDLVLE